MTLRKLTIVPMLAMALFAVGCGPDCESQCEDRNECEDIPEEFKEDDCAKFCEEIEKDVEAEGCEDQYDDLLSCGGDIEDVCKPDEDACESEQEAFNKCMGIEIPEIPE